MNRAAVEQIIELLLAAQKTPVMYIGRIDASLTDAFLHGFQLACSPIDPLRQSWEVRRRVLEEQDLMQSAYGPVYCLRRRKLSEAEIVHELFAIEIETWQRILASVEENR